MYELNRLDPALYYTDGENKYPLPFNKLQALDVVDDYWNENSQIVSYIGSLKSASDTRDIMTFEVFKPCAEEFLDNVLPTMESLLINSVALYMTVFVNKAVHFIGEGFADSETNCGDEIYIEDPATTSYGLPALETMRTLEYALLSRDGWIDAKRLAIAQRYYPDFKVMQLTNSTDPQGVANQNKICMVTFVYRGIKFRYDRGLISSSLKAALSRA